MKFIERLKEQRKGQLGAGVNALAALGIGFVTFAVVLALSGTVVSDLNPTAFTCNKSTESAGGVACNSVANNATRQSTVGMGTMVGYIPLIATVATIAIVLGIVMVAFRGRK